MLFVSERESEAQLTEPLNPRPLSPPLANSRAAANATSTATRDSMSKNFTSLSEQMPQGAAQPASSGDQSYVEKVKRMDAQTLIKTLRYVNVILAIMQAFAGFSGIFDLVVLDITSFLISVYAMYVVVLCHSWIRSDLIFALLLLAFECRFASMEPTIRQYFGFLFTYRGRAAFLFFVGFMNFGMNGSFSKFVGILMCANAFFELAIITCHPEFKNGHLSSTMDPTATYTGASEETAQLLAQNQDYAAKAGAYVLQQAQQNPQFVAQAAQGLVNPGYVPPPVVSH